MAQLTVAVDRSREPGPAPLQQNDASFVGILKAFSMFFGIVPAAR
jgi:hypothetical protein